MQVRGIITRCSVLFIITHSCMAAALGVDRDLTLIDLIT
jgi:hypothetical protein